MSSTLLFYGHFTTGGSAATDLTVTVDITRITRSDGTQTTSVNGGSATQVTTPNKDGLYLYQLTGADLTLYDYVAVFKTSGTCDLNRIPAMYSAFPGDTVSIAGTAQTARDLGNALPAAAPNTNGGLPILSSSGTTLAYTISTLTTYTGNTPQTGDSFARIGATGSGLTSLAPSATALSTAQWTNSRATALDNLDATVSSRLATSGYTAPLDAAGTRSAVGLAAANLDTQLATLAGYIDTEVGAIKAKTDQLTFTVSGKVDATAAGYASGQDPATLVLDVATSLHNTSGSIGAAIGAAGGNADPLLNLVPGSYASDTAGWVLGQLLAAAVIYTGPTNPVTGDMTIIRGDDYQSGDGHGALGPWSLPYGSGNPDLTGATVTASFYPPNATSSALDATPTVSSPGTSNQTISLTLTAAQTATLTQNGYRVVFSALLATTEHVDTFLRVRARVERP